uniref:proline-rich receptor-like protein kinase PERK14 n=1 Tax=Podarcis muralis TaxID=64176 RepID=UPI0010A0044C|nr:proline-rich receptor-like protein kinase PERK14 [Podarcis muralis]
MQAKLQHTISPCNSAPPPRGSRDLAPASPFSPEEPWLSSPAPLPAFLPLLTRGGGWRAGIRLTFRRSPPAAGRSCPPEPRSPRGEAGKASRGGSRPNPPRSPSKQQALRLSPLGSSPFSSCSLSFIPLIRSRLRSLPLNPKQETTPTSLSRKSSHHAGAGRVKFASFLPPRVRARNGRVGSS